MPKRRRHLRLISSDPSNIFDDLERLQAEQRTPVARRPRSRETFARIPHDKGLQLCQLRISCAAWAVLLELDQLILKAGGRNPVSLFSPRLKAIGLLGQARARALRQLQAAGVVSVSQRGKGLSPWVTHLCFEKRRERCHQRHP
jgi:hypothetical protein